MGQLVEGGELSGPQVLEALERAGIAAGLTQSEVNKTIASGMAAGRQTPRKAPTPATGTETNEPTPFWNRDAKEEPFPLEVLPPVLLNSVKEYQAFGQQPMAMCASAALATVNVVTQGLVDVARDSILVGPSSLFFLIVGDSGERKSALDGHFSSVVREWEREDREQGQEQRKKALDDLDAWKAEKAGILDAIRQARKGGHEGKAEQLRETLREHSLKEPKLPALGDMFYEDANPAALMDRLANRGAKRAALWSSEALAVTGGGGMARENIQSFFALLNKLWSGESVTSTRKVSRSARVENVRFGASLMMQQQVFSHLLGERNGLARGCGVLARFLLCAPASTMGSRTYKLPTANMPASRVFSQRVRELLRLPLHFDPQGRLAPYVMPLSPKAKAGWVVYHDRTESQLSPTGSLFDVKDFAAKNAENAARIAATFQCLETGPTGEVSEGNMKRGCILALWFVREAQRVFGLLETPEQEKAAKLMLAFLGQQLAKGEKQVTTSYLLRYGPNSLRNKSTRDSSLAVLRANGWVKNLSCNTVAIHPATLGVQDELV